MNRPILILPLAVLLVAPIGGSAGADRQLKVKRANPFPDDRRLEIRVTFKARRPTFRDLLDRMGKEIGVQLTADQRLEDQECTFALTVFNEPAWVVMDLIAKQMLTDGRWTRFGDGYRLLGGPSHQQPDPLPPVSLLRRLVVALNVPLLIFLLLVAFRLQRGRNRVNQERIPSGGSYSPGSQEGAGANEQCL